MKRISMLLTLATIILCCAQIAYGGEGHDAGYEWAQEHDITDVNYDNGNSESFNEGVRQYAEEQQEEEQHEQE